MDDALRMGGRDPRGDLLRASKQLPTGQRAEGESLPQRLPLEQFGDDVELAAGISDVEHGDDIRMVERAGGAGLLLEAAEQIAISRETFVENLDGDVTAQPGVLGSIDYAHAALADHRDDLIRPEPLPRLVHPVRLLYPWNCSRYRRDRAAQRNTEVPT